VVGKVRLEKVDAGEWKPCYLYIFEVTQYLLRNGDKRTNSKERNKKRNRSNVKKTKKNSNKDLIINDCLCKLPVQAGNMRS